MVLNHTRATDAEYKGKFRAEMQIVLMSMK
jgi:hypothetical protein